MQTVPRRRNPPGTRGLRAYAASLVVDDAPASLSSSLLASASQAPGARAIPIPGQAPRNPLRASGGAARSLKTAAVLYCQPRGGSPIEA